MNDEKDFEDIARENIALERENKIGKTAKSDIEQLVVDTICDYPKYSAKQIGEKVGVTPTMVNEIKAKYAEEITNRTGRKVKTAKMGGQKEEDNGAPHQSAEPTASPEGKPSALRVDDAAHDEENTENGGVNFVIVDEKKDEAREKAAEMVKAGDDPSSVSLRSTASPLGSQVGDDTSSVGSADSSQSRGNTLVTPFEAFWKGRAFCLLDVIRACIENGEPVKHKHIHELDMICEMLALMEDDEDEV